MNCVRGMDEAGCTIVVLPIWAGKCIYILFMFTTSIPFQASSRGHLKQRTISLASATRYYMHSHWRWPWQSRTPFNTQKSVTQQISRSLYLGHFSRCSLHLPVETYILASSVIIEPRNSLYFTCDWNGSKLNRVYINCAVNVPNRRKKLSFDATLRTCERRKESCDRFECVCVSIAFELRLESQRCTQPIYWEHAGNRKVQQICIAVGQLAEVWFHVQHQSEAKSVIRLFKEQNLFLPSHVIHYMWPASCTHTHTRSCECESL